MEIKHKIEDDVLIIDLKGDLQDKVMYKMKPFILDVVNKDFKKIVLDMKEVESVDVSWCDYLCKMYKVMNDYGRKLAISGCPGSISDVNYTKKVRDIYPLFSTFEEAKTYLGNEKKDKIATSQSSRARNDD